MTSSLKIEEKKTRTLNLIGAVPMVTMAKSAANGLNKHTHVDCTHSHTYKIHEHSTTTWCEAPAQLVISEFAINFLF